MTKDVWICLADGFEEVEALSPADYLRRAGAQLSLLSMGSRLLVSGSHGIVVQADGLFSDRFKEGATLPAAIVVPGGLPASKTLAESPELAQALLAVLSARGLVAAICAAPRLVLAPTGMLSERRWTCYPGMESDCDVGIWIADRVAIDGNLITARGPGCAEEFSLAIVEYLYGTAKKEEIVRAIVAREP